MEELEDSGPGMGEAVEGGREWSRQTELTDRKTQTETEDSQIRKGHPRGWAVLVPRPVPSFFSFCAGLQGCEIREILLAGISFRGPTITASQRFLGKGTWLHENCSV